MICGMRERPLLACTFGAALTAACGSDGGGTGSASNTDATTETSTEPQTQGSSADPTPATTGPTTDAPTTAPTTDSSGGSDTGDTTTGAPACPYTPVEGTPKVALELVASGFDRPVLAIAHPTQPDRLFVVEQGGHVKILEPGMTTAPPDADDFLYIPVKNENAAKIGPEQGLLSLAFHPDFPTDPRVYIYFNPGEVQGNGPNHIAELKLDPNDPDKVDPASLRLVYAMGKVASNHNGGMLNFGPDGMLYFGTGDGGGANDEFGTGRDPKSPLAKILRIDPEPDGVPDSNKACAQCPMADGFDFTVPADNPHVGDANYAPEVYAMGMRNPWRFVFDTATDDLYVGDVGQGSWEEVSIIQAGKDYGWSAMEGTHCFADDQCDEGAGPNQENMDGITMPIIEYSHDDNGRCSITGLGVYHSCEVPGWDGVYFYADYCSSEIFALRWDGNATEDLGVVASANGESILGTGHNAYGDIFVTTVVVDALNVLLDGKVYRVVPG